MINVPAVSGADGLASVTSPTGWMAKSKRIVAALDSKCFQNRGLCRMTSCTGLVNTILGARRQEILDRREINSMEAGQRSVAPDVRLSQYSSRRSTTRSLKEKMKLVLKSFVRTSTTCDQRRPSTTLSVKFFIEM